MWHFSAKKAALAAAVFLFSISAKSQTQPCAAWSNFPWHDWIAAVRLGPTEQASGKSQFTDHTLIEFEAVAGQALPLELTTGFSWENFDENWRIWADFDQNGQFDEAAELLFSAVQKAGTSGVLAAKTTAFLNIPASAPVGKFRLRVAMRRGAEPPTACGATDFGEIEDFSLKITAGQPPAPCSLKVEIVETACIDSLNDTYRIRFLATGTPSTWKTEIGGEAFSGPVGQPFSLPKDLQISDGEWLLRVFDPSAPACRASDKTVPPAPCSATPTVIAETVYCPIQGSFPWHDWLEKIRIDGEENASGKSKYSDFTQNGPVFMLRAGGVAAVELTAGFSYFTHQERFKIWIDFNRNGIFEEPSEVVLRSIMAAPKAGTLAETIAEQLVLPAGAPLGTTRMRVAMSRNAWASGCGSFHFGEAEDYAVEILPPAPVAPSEEVVFHSNESKMEEISPLAPAEIRPNPASGSAHLFFENEENEVVRAELIDPSGRLIFSKKWLAEKGQNALELPISGLADGVYFWKIWRGDRAETGRLAVRN